MTAKKQPSDGKLSDEPQEETIVGNVSKLAVTPPGYEGNIKKGHLVFDACFESGNLGRVDYISEFEYDLFIRPDTCNTRFRVWFYFTVENNRADQRVIFNIVNFSKTKSLYREGMSPVVKSTSRPKWQRIPSKTVFYYKCPDHRKNYVMSFAFCFDRKDETYSFAYSFPYCYSRLDRYLTKLESRNLDYFKRETLAWTVQQRKLELLTITSPGNQCAQRKQKVVFVTSRVHPGESPASYVMQGFIDFLTSKHAMAQVLRDAIVFKIVPMLNPDGVYLGNYRCSLMGFDLNRHWQDPSPWAHPTLDATKQYLMQLNANPDTEVEFYIDMHAHSTLSNCFMYGNIYDDEVRFQRQSVFPRLMCAICDDFSYANTAFNRDTVKAGTGRRLLGGVLDEAAHCYTLEVSFYNYHSGNCLHVPYTPELYMKIGRNLCKTFIDYYKLSPMLSMCKPWSGSNASSTTSVSSRDRKNKPTTNQNNLKQSR